ncbi:PQQ-dependent sugar dehydrogenase [Amycolatopsis regifaucium]|uniref:Sugar dehydrogenase n=1 Tax=Amycolatopsis regifaucium TaxID=546365 RepID=A0A154MMF1_9PSEU|nr:PQQ-dependent sugar dehydrogenase [Amycolatopsis regifaucium]KZB85230.1 sugar dehydrogenase [Amycolatopsis regifaucium]OKA03792.1 sugar dehydrogenase [Amycolatopsis regifaucium]SFH89560.1 LGFP repeat-containing protein [Amycolatopsis regifaucium]
MIGNRLLTRVLIALSVSLLLLPGWVNAPEAIGAPALPSGFVLRDQPSGQAAFDLTDFAYLPDGSVLSTGKSGKVAWVSDTGQSRTIATLPVRDNGDLGLVGLAVAPDFATSRQIYLTWSFDTGGGFTMRVARWTVTGTDVPTGLANERVLVDLPGFHDVHGVTGLIAAGDGTLWISIGDAADFTRMDPGALRALDLDQLYGKILHVTSDGVGVPGNPYYAAAAPNSNRSKVFSSGYRSPFRFSLDPRLGLPVVGDVGWNTWEEVNVVRPGDNHAWPCWEGNIPTPGYSGLAGCAGVVNTPPITAHHHGSGADEGNSVTAGIVYSGSSYPDEYRGAFFFGDYATQKIWTMTYDSQGRLVQAPQRPPRFTGVGGPVKFAAAANGDIVYADIYTGNLRRLSYPGTNAEPVAVATSSTEPSTRTVTFDGTGSYDFDGDPLAYHWDFGDGTSQTGARVSHPYAAGVGTVTARLTVTDRLGATGGTDVVVVPANHSPELGMTDLGARTYAVGEPVAVGASATDAEDGALPITWTTLIRHCPEEATCHAHPGASGTGPSFSMPFTDHQDSRVEITATVTDGAGVTARRTYVARPREHLLTLTGNVPAALGIPAEGGVGTAMVTEGATFEVVAAEVAADGVSTFSTWSDGRTSRTITITVPPRDLTLTATYRTPIDKRYQADPALRQRLGAPTGPEVIDGTVRYRPYTGGRLYWSAETGVKQIEGQILAKYLAQGGHRKFGPPATDEMATPDGVGRYNHFPNWPGTLQSSIYWTMSTGAHPVYGRIRVKWAALGWEAGPLGYPTTDELPTPDGIGRFNHFSKNSSIYYTVQTDAKAIWGRIRARWEALGWEAGPLGYPTMEEAPTPDGIGRFVHFTEAGSIYWTTQTDAHGVWGAIRQRWEALDWEAGYLRYPTTDEFSVPGGRQNNFQGGDVFWNASNGAVTDRRR